MIFDLIRNNKTLKELLLGILIFTAVCEVVVLIFTKNIIYNSVGLIVGAVVSGICAVHMAWGIDIAVGLDEKSSIALTKKYTVIRYLIMCAVLVAVGISDVGSPVTLILGFMGLKAGAYLNPIVHKLTTKNDGGDDN